MDVYPTAELDNEGAVDRRGRDGGRMNKTALRRLAVRGNELRSRAGFYVLPLSYYSEVPNRRWLRENPDLWARPILPIGQDWDLSRQLSWLRATCSPYIQEVAGSTKYPGITGFATSYGPID